MYKHIDLTTEPQNTLNIKQKRENLMRNRQLIYDNSWRFQYPNFNN